MKKERRLKVRLRAGLQVVDYEPIEADIELVETIDDEKDIGEEYSRMTEEVLSRVEKGLERLYERIHSKTENTRKHGHRKA